MDSELDEAPSPKRRRTEETGPYILRTLIDKVQLAAEEGSSPPDITYVELFGQFIVPFSMSLP